MGELGIAIRNLGACYPLTPQNNSLIHVVVRDARACMGLIIASLITYLPVISLLCSFPICHLDSLFLCFVLDETISFREAAMADLARVVVMPLNEERCL